MKNKALTLSSRWLNAGKCKRGRWESKLNIYVSCVIVNVFWKVSKAMTSLLNSHHRPVDWTWFSSTSPKKWQVKLGTALVKCLEVVSHTCTQHGWIKRGVSLLFGLCGGIYHLPYYQPGLEPGQVTTKVAGTVAAVCRVSSWTSGRVHTSVY